MFLCGHFEVQTQTATMLTPPPPLPAPGMDGQERGTGTQEEFSKRGQSKRGKREEGMGRDEKERVREKREEGGGVEQDRSG